MSLTNKCKKNVLPQLDKQPQQSVYYLINNRVPNLDRAKDGSGEYWEKLFIGLAYQGKDIVFRFIIIEYSSFMDFMATR
jgi:hypothetical protein